MKSHYQKSDSIGEAKIENRHVVPVAPNGRMNLPSVIRSKLELEGGGKVVFIEKENGEVEVTTLRRSLKHAQDLVRQYIPNGAGVVDDLIAERRAEAVREAGDENGALFPSTTS